MSRFTTYGETPIPVVKPNRFKVGATPSESIGAFKSVVPEPIAASMPNSTPAMLPKTPFEATNAGVLANTVLGLPKATVDVGREIAQGIARTTAGVGMTAGNIPTQITNIAREKKQPLPFDESIPTAGVPIASTVFGGKPVKTLQKSITDVQQMTEPYVGKSVSKFAAAPLVIGGVALDLSGLGGAGRKAGINTAEKFLTHMAVEKDPVIIENTLLKARIDPIKAKTIAPAIAEADTPEAVKNVFDNYTNNLGPLKPPAQVPSGPGYKKFSTGIDKLVASKTLHPEDGTILKSLFADTKDEFLNNIDIKDTMRAGIPGRATYKAVNPIGGKLNMRKGLAGMPTGEGKGMEFWNSPSTHPSKVFLHEYGHIAHAAVLTPEERVIVTDVWSKMKKEGRTSMFKGGLSNVAKEGSMVKSADYYGRDKNDKEFLAQSFAEYIIQNKVPSEQMRPLLQRLLTRFADGLLRLVQRGDVPHMDRMTPIFEKMLSGDKNSPLANFMKDKPVSYKEDILKMLQERKTKEVPIEELMPSPIPKTTPTGREGATLPSQAVPSEPLQTATPSPTGQMQIPESIKTDPTATVSYTKSIQDTILDARDAQAKLEAFQATAVDPIEHPVQAWEVRDMFKSNPGLVDDVGKLKDIGNTKKQFRDIYRNTAQVFGKYSSIIDKHILEPFNQSKGRYIDSLNRELDDLSRNVPFDKGSKESKYIQMFGEKKVTMDELIKEFGEQKATDIAKADTWFRAKYDKQLAELNAVEQQIYPNSPYKWTPAHADYYRHFHDLSSDFSRLQNILENPIRIDPMLVGISEQTAPKSKWASFKQRRFGTETKEDAVGGYLDYLPSVSYAVHIDPNIGRFREMAEVLSRGTQETKNLNNYIYNLRMFANELSGKTPEVDRLIMETIPGGRTSLQVVDWVNRRVKANTMLFNASASLNQVLNVPQGIASAGPVLSSKAAVKTLGQIFTENKAMQQSTFLKERYFKGFNQFDKGILNNTKKFGGWLLTALDEAGTKFIWNGQYEKAIQESVQNPIKYADDATKKLVAGRGIGEKPLMQNSKVFQVIAPFQLEVTNLWWAMEDLAKTNPGIMNKFGKFATLFVSLYLTNSAIQSVTGNRPALDPIQAVIDAVDTLKADTSAKGAAKAGGRLFGEVLSNVPGGQTVAAAYPEFGTSVLPTRKQLFGRADPTRFGGGLLVGSAATDPLYKLLPPFGGGQLKKTIQGLSAVEKGKSTTKSGAYQYKIERTPANYAKAALFGKASTSGGSAYYEKKNAPAKKSTGAGGARFKQY